MPDARSTITQRGLKREGGGRAGQTRQVGQLCAWHAGLLLMSRTPPAPQPLYPQVTKEPEKMMFPLYSQPHLHPLLLLVVQPMFIERLLCARHCPWC